METIRSKFVFANCAFFTFLYALVVRCLAYKSRTHLSQCWICSFHQASSNKTAHLLSFQLIIFCSIYYFVPAYWGDYVFPTWVQVLGWLVCVSSMGCVPLGALYAFCTNKGSFRSIFETSGEFCPAGVRQLMMTSQAEARFRYYAQDNEGYLSTEVKVNKWSYVWSSCLSYVEGFLIIKRYF